MDLYINTLYEKHLFNIAIQHNMPLKKLIHQLYELHYQLEEQGDTKNRSDGDSINIKQGQKRKRGRPKKINKLI